MAEKKFAAPPAARVLQFPPGGRPRAAASAGGPPGNRPDGAASPVDDLGKYSRHPDEPDDYRHRQMVNAAALVLCMLLILGGLWLADTIADLRKTQDCVLSGRRNCAELHIDGSPR